eukprot:7113157-Prymnesium_polylepis.2
MCSTTQQDEPRAAAVGFANMEEPLHEKILGRKVFEPGRLDRRKNEGGRVTVEADYKGAILKGHDVIPVVHE